MRNTRRGARLSTFNVADFSRFTGFESGPCPGYWKDHIGPLACVGPDTVSNLDGKQSATRGPRTRASEGFAFTSVDLARQLHHSADFKVIYYL
jgi:hypothetical protein